MATGSYGSTRPVVSAMARVVLGVAVLPIILLGGWVGWRDLLLRYAAIRIWILHTGYPRNSCDAVGATVDDTHGLPPA